MRLIREARRLECENQRRESRRSHLKKWLDLSHGHNSSDEDQTPEDHKQQGEDQQQQQQQQQQNRHLSMPFGLSVARRAATVSPLAPSLKKSQSPSRQVELLH